VVYYGAYLRIFEVGRTEFMRSVLGISYRSLESSGLLFPVSEVYCRYKASAMYDDLLEVRTSLASFSRVSLRFHYEILRSDDARLLALGYTVHAAVDGSGRLSSLPHDLQAALGALDAGG
jgi:acyl-CoA thioester hydrolase